MRLEDLTPEQQERAHNCKTPEEIFELAKEVGYELSAEEIDAVAGGMVDTSAPIGGVGDGWSL